MVIVGAAVIASLLATYALIYVGAALVAPRFFLDDLSLNDERFKRLPESVADRPSPSWRYYVLLFALTLGLIIVMYHLLNAVTMWIPETWRSTADGSPDVRAITGQICLSLLLGLLVAESLLNHDAGAHLRVRPADYRLSSWARRGYERADEIIKHEDRVLRPELTSDHFAIEFYKGWSLRLAEEGDRDAIAGAYRPETFENNRAYEEGWLTAASRMQAQGWRHPTVSKKLDEHLAERAAEQAAREKEYWKARLGFDPDEALRDP